MAEIPLSWRVSQSGAEAVKQRFAELNDQLERGEITQQQYGKGTRELRRDASDLTAGITTQRKVFQATHPTLMNLGRGMSAISTVMRTTVAITMALNIAQIAMQGKSEALSQAEADLQQATRERLNALREYGPESIEYANALDNEASAAGRLKKMQDQLAQQDFSNIANAVTSFGLLGSTITQNILNPGVLTKLRSGLRAVGVAAAFANVRIAALFGTLTTGAGVSALALTAASLAAVAAIAGGFVIGTELREENRSWLETIQNDWHNFVQDVSWLAEILNKALFAAWASITTHLFVAWHKITSGFRDFWNNMVMITNLAMFSIGKGIESFVNGIISAAESAANALRSLSPIPLAAISLPRISIPAPQIPMIAAAQGFHGMVSGPTMVLAGEAGPERIDISPMGRSATSVMSSGGGGNTIIVNEYITVQGSVWTSKQLFDAVDDHRESSLRKRGFKTRLS